MTLRVKDIWQEYCCPHSFDFDLSDGEMVHQGQAHECSGCGGAHTGGDNVINQTTVLHVDDTNEHRTYMEQRGIPKDAAEKAAWLAEIGQTSPAAIDDLAFDWRPDAP